MQSADFGTLMAAEGTLGYRSGWQGCTRSTLHGHGTLCPVGSVFSVCLSCCTTSSLHITSWAHEQLLVGHLVAEDMTRRGKPWQHLMDQHHICLEPNPEVKCTLDAIASVKSCNVADGHHSMLELW